MCETKDDRMRTTPRTSSLVERRVDRDGESFADRCEESRLLSGEGYATQISANCAYCGAQRTHLLVDRLRLGRLLGFLGRGAREEAHDFVTAEEGAATAHVASLGSPLNREEAHRGTKGRAITARRPLWSWDQQEKCVFEKDSHRKRCRATWPRSGRHDEIQIWDLDTSAGRSA